MKRKQKSQKPEISREDWQQASLERFKPLLNAGEFDALLEELQHPLEPSFRVNPLKMKPEAVQEMADRYQWKLQRVPFCPTGYRLMNSPSPQALSQTLEHRMGQYYIQEAASMLPVELFHMENSAPELCLDLAASPGGKTTHLIARGGDHSLVIANDSSAGRIPALQIVLQNWGAANQMITRFPGEKFGAWFPETFDRVLIDAPCSMQGLRAADSHDVRPVTGNEITALAKRQVALLTSALQAVKAGGEVVYSTCTLEPEEDEAVIEAILDRFGSKVELLQTGIQAPGLSSYGEESFPPEMEKSLRLWPNRFHTAGFFACLIRKTAALDMPSLPPPSRPLARTGFAPLSLPAQRKLADALQSSYGFDLNAVLNEYDLTVVGYHDRRFAFPGRLMSQFADLPVQSAGLPIGDETPEGFIPSHAWISRFVDRFTAGKVVIPDEDIEAWLNYEELSNYGNIPDAPSVVLLVDAAGRFLGRGRLAGNRIRNLLPRHSR
jgi:16S rRNA (cytosine1407-C5)-methyltransferase